MTNSLDRIPSIFITGLSQAEFEKLTDPDRDPALVLPDFSSGTLPPKDGAAIPSVEEIEAALNNHVRLGISPKAMIKDLLHPFVEDDYAVSLTPGMGKKRPSYALHVKGCNLLIARSSTRTVAERLHSIASDISRFEIGKYASPDAPTLRLKIPGNYDDIDIKARDINTLQGACLAAFGYLPEFIYVNLNKKFEDILPHVFAARDLISQKETKNKESRQRASQLIYAVQELRMITIIALRQYPGTRLHEAYSFNLSFGPDPKFTIEEVNHGHRSAHEKIERIAFYNNLRDTLLAKVRQHPVLANFPDTLGLRMSGESDYLTTNIIDTAKPLHVIDASISLADMDYKNLTSFAQKLDLMISPDMTQNFRWQMNLSGHLRTKHSWDLSGPTLAHAFANELEKDDAQMPTEIQDLMMDLCVDSSGNPVNVDLYRVFSH